MTSKVQRIPRYEGNQILAGSASRPSDAGGILLVGTTPSAEQDAAFNDWFDQEHGPALTAVLSPLSARRFMSVGPSTTRYVARYHLIESSVQESAAWKRASGDTPMPRQVRDTTTGWLRLVCNACERA